MKKFYSEFKTFISRGNILDLAVAVVIGTAFTRIVNSLVKDILTPIISLITGEEGFTNYKYVITAGDEANNIQENAIYYGQFIQNIFDFIIIAFVVFFIVRFINKTRSFIDRAEDFVQEKKQKTDPVLLDIKDLLRRNLEE